MWGDFGGSAGGFVQTQSGNSSSATGTSKQRANQNLVPCSIAQIHMASSSDSEQGFLINGLELNSVVVCGVVRNIQTANTNVTYVLDDYTAPPLDIKQWIDSEDDNSGMSDSKNPEIATNEYIRVYGSIRSFQGKRNIVAFRTERITDMNQMVLHLIEVLHAHLVLQKRQQNPNFSVSGAPSLANNSSAGPQSMSGGSSMNQSMGMSMGGSLDQGLSGLHKQIYQLILSYKSENGISLSEIKSSVTSVNHNELRKAIEFLSDEGHIYSTVDDEHYKSTNEDD